MQHSGSRPRRVASSPSIFLWLVLLALLVAASACVKHHVSSSSPLRYPASVKVDHVDDYHGTVVPDPYRWLEDDNAPTTRDWVQAQNAVTFGYLDSIPQRSRIKQRLTKLWNYERYGVPRHRGQRYFLTRNDGLQNQSVLYSLDDLRGRPKLLLDPNTLSSDGTVALNSWVPSCDGNLLAYGLSTAGSDWLEWRVRDVAKGTDLEDHLRWVKFSAASWAKDGSGFYYSRYDEPKPGEQLKGVNYFQKLYFHRLGTPQSEDQLVYQRPDQKEWGFGGQVTEDGRFLVISVWRGSDTKSALFYKDLRAPDSPVVELLNGFDAGYEFVESDGSTMFLRTDKNSPRGRLIAIDVERPEAANWKEILPEQTNRLESVDFLDNKFVASYLEDACNAVKIFDRAGALIGDVKLPGLGTAVGFSGESQDTETFYLFTSFTVPGTIYRYDLRSGESSVFREPSVPFDPKDYETKLEFYRSKDGTRVPMFITHKKRLALNGTQPTYLYGYGGFDASLSPWFSPVTLAWMEMGGIYAQPGLRGGGEYGEEWHKAGMGSRKQNVFDDFIAAAEWLIEHNYTKPAKLAIGGGSNGGLLVGACLTQRPDLFGAALPAVGVMDMLRFHKFTIGWAWVTEYGSADNPEQFRSLYAYSPLHSLVPGTHYPATLITTADHDDRVVPAHSFKFAAALQAAQAGPDPVLIRIETRAGHGMGKPTSKQIEEAADRWAFLVRELGM